MIFTPRQKTIHNGFSVMLNDCAIDRVKETVFLGVILDEHISWKPHISHVARKISKSIGIIYKASFLLSKSSLCKLYYSLFYPYLQYPYLPIKFKTHYFASKAYYKNSE